jgi:hypothetical protein
VTASSRTPPGSPRGPRRDEGPPATAGEAFERARAHGRAAAAELLLCLGSLLDAASLAASGTPAAAGALAPLAQTLSGLASDLGRDARGADSLLAALTHALDAEIARWEARSLEDPDARAVLRAFLGLREILWELGLRRPEASAREPERPARDPARPGPAARPRRVERVRVEGA